MIIISLTSYPPESAVEMGKRFLDMPALPNFITMRGPYISSIIEKGIKGITLYEFDESKYGEAFKVLSDRSAKFFGVPGFSYSLNHWLEAKDALKLVGLG
ncbi:MAG: hypothetical protein C4518_13610 [Desulfobacteraceae bacterium]|nr:MAG: hypothetical protein C4518_13610 [Desulfobacteraceae bacterium]